jgi:hypothetical protein
MNHDIELMLIRDQNECLNATNPVNSRGVWTFLSETCKQFNKDSGEWLAIKPAKKLDVNCSNTYTSLFQNNNLIKDYYGHINISYAVVCILQFLRIISAILTVFKGRMLIICDSIIRITTITFFAVISRLSYVFIFSLNEKFNGPDDNSHVGILLNQFNRLTIGIIVISCLSVISSISNIIRKLV